MRSALRKSVLRLGVSTALLAALHWGIPYLRHQPGLSAPTHSAVSALLTVSRVGLAIFLLAELSLLAGAVLTVRRPELHRRFLNLMFFWSYVLVAPYLLIKSRRPPQHFLITDIVVARPLPAARPANRGARRGLPQPGAGPPRLSSGTPGETGRAASLPAEVTGEEYRKALELLLRHTRILQQDRELLDLLLRQLTDPERRDHGTGRTPAPAEAVEASPPQPPAGEPAGARPGAPPPAEAEPPPAPVRSEEYRKALLVLLQHTEVLRGDRELLNLVLEQLTDTAYDGHIAELGQVRPTAKERGRVSAGGPGPAGPGPGSVPGPMSGARRAANRRATYVTKSVVPGRTLNHGTLTAAASSGYEG